MTFLGFPYDHVILYSIVCPTTNVYVHPASPTHTTHQSSGLFPSTFAALRRGKSGDTRRARIHPSKQHEASGLRDGGGDGCGGVDPSLGSQAWHAGIRCLPSSLDVPEAGTTVVVINILVVTMVAPGIAERGEAVHSRRAARFDKGDGKGAATRTRLAQFEGRKRGTVRHSRWRRYVHGGNDTTTSSSRNSNSNSNNNRRGGNKRCAARLFAVGRATGWAGPAPEATPVRPLPG